MSETFTTFNKRPLLFYFWNLVNLSFFALVIWAWGTDMFIQPKYTTLIITLFVVGLLSVCSYVIVTGTGIVKMYTINGEMKISDGAINLNNLTIFLPEISSMEVRARDYRGARSSDGSGNWIMIKKKSHEKIETRFVIASKIQKNSLGQILQKWKDDGLPISITI